MNATPYLSYSMLSALSGPVIACIVMAAVAVAIALVCLVLFLCERKRTSGHRNAGNDGDRTQEETAARQDARETAAEEAQEEPIAAERKEEAEAVSAEEISDEPQEEPITTKAAEEGESVVEPISEKCAVVVSEEEGTAESERALKVVFASSNRLVSVRYDRSFTARLIQADDVLKGYYSELKNELLSYRKVRARTSWRQESFRKGRELYAKLEVRGKTLCLYLALDPAAYADSKYIVEDVSELKRNEFTPCLYRIKNDRRLRYAKELIATLFADTEPVKNKVVIDYAAEIPYEELDPLLERGLVKIIEEKEDETPEPIEEEGITEVTEEAEETEVIGVAEEAEAPEPEHTEHAASIGVAEAETLMDDEQAKKSLTESGRYALKGLQTIVNVDTLGEYFRDGEYVTFEEMKARIPFLNKRAVCVKVLARGTLSKALYVEADDFSLGAVKMIVLAGGKVYRNRAYGNETVGGN